MDKMNNHSQAIVSAAGCLGRKMESNILQFLTSKAIPIYKTPSSISSTKATPQTQIFIPHRRRSPRLNSTNNSVGSDDTLQPPAPPTVTPPETVEIRFKRGSRKRNRRQTEDDVRSRQPAKAQARTPDAPKKWEDMNLTEKSLEVYMGEKGLLFWLNKFAYASIFIMIGGWILFRFVGPSLNLYQLDTTPLAPSSVFKGS